MNPHIIILTNLMTIRMNDDLDPYERATYVQLLSTTKAHARLEELRIDDAIKDIQDGQRTNQTPGGVSPSTPQAEEHRGDDSTPTV